MNLLVTEKELKEEYRHREWQWNTFYRRVAQKYAEVLWKNNPLILYPLSMDIAIGNMKYRYFKFGIKHVWNRINRYHEVFARKFRGRDVDLEVDSEQFYIRTVLTNEEDILDQLDKEIREFY